MIIVAPFPLFPADIWYMRITYVAHKGIRRTTNTVAANLLALFQYDSESDHHKTEPNKSLLLQHAHVICRKFQALLTMSAHKPQTQHSAMLVCYSLHPRKKTILAKYHVLIF